MKRFSVLAVLILALCVVLAACGCAHKYEERITTEASCTAVGVKTFTCTLCNESYTEEISMIEHSYTSTVTKEPSCVEKGVTTFTCSVCNDSYSADIEMIDHVAGEATVVKKPTCTEEGEKVAACTVCGKTDVAEKISKIEHDYSAKVTTVPTCTATGVETLTCKSCGNTTTDAIPKIAHKYKSEVAQNASCTANGKRKYICTSCDDSYFETIEKLGHDYSKIATTKQVTCTEDGARTVSCSRCGDFYDEVVKTKGHDWVEATCTAAKHCAMCNQVDGSALGHTTDDGTCSRCGKVFSVADKCSLTTQNSIPCGLVVEMYSNPAAPYISMQFTDVNYKFSAQGDGKVRLNLDFDVYISHAGFSTASFYVKLYDPAGRLIKNQKVYTEDTATGLYTTADTSFKNLEPGAYTIKITAKS